MKLRYIGILLVFATFAAYSQKRKTESFSEVNSIRLTAGSGSAKFIKGSGSNVRVTIEYDYDDEDFEYKMEKRGSTLFLDEKYHGNFSRGDSKWTIETPDDLDVRFTSGSGDLEIDGLTLEFKSNQGSGSVNTTNTKGDFTLTTGSGDYEIKNHDGDLRLTAGSGQMFVSEASGELEFTTGSGDIELSKCKGNLTATVGSGDVEARDVELMTEGKFTSGSGNVDVVLSSETQAVITMASGSGDATLDFGGKPINASIVMEAGERHGRIVAPFKFDKEEIIEHSGYDTIRKSVKLGNGKADIRISTGSGTAEIKK